MEKPGYKTTEFWLSLLVIIIAAVTSSGAIPEGHWILTAIAFVSSALVAAGYSNARARTKFGESVKAANPPPAQ